MRFLFKALIRLLIKIEVEGARRLEQVFEQNSKCARLIQMFCCHRYWMWVKYN